MVLPFVIAIAILVTQISSQVDDVTVTVLSRRNPNQHRQAVIPIDEGKVPETKTANIDLEKLIKQQEKLKELRESRNEAISKSLAANSGSNSNGNGTQESNSKQIVESDINTWTTLINNDYNLDSSSYESYGMNYDYGKVESKFGEKSDDDSKSKENLIVTGYVLKAQNSTTKVENYPFLNDTSIDETTALPDITTASDLDFDNSTNNIGSSFGNLTLVQGNFTDVNSCLGLKIANYLIIFVFIMFLF